MLGKDMATCASSAVSNTSRREDSVPDGLPYGRQTIGASDVSAVARATISPYLTQGPRVRDFEKALADYVGVRNAVTFSSGTAALHAAAVAAGVSNGNRFITTPLSFVASANCALYCGIRPRFVDVDPWTANLDPIKATELANMFVDPVILTVSLAGLPAVLPQTTGIVIEDACHALGAIRDGQPVGKEADITVFSFHPVKVITTGEGGAAVTDNDEFAEAMREFRHHGIRRSEDPEDPLKGPWHYDIHEIGHNYRLTDIQSALGIEQLKRLDEFISRRQAIASRYRHLLYDVDNIELPPAPWSDRTTHAYHLFVVRFPEGPDRRRTVYEYLRDQGIGTQLHYIPIPVLTVYQKMGYSMAGLPNAQKYYEEALSIPIFPTMTKENIERVARELKVAMTLPVDSWKRSMAKQSSSLVVPAHSGPLSSVLS